MANPKLHGRTEFFIEGEGFASEDMRSPRLKQMTPGMPSPEIKKTGDDAKRAFRFCRMFPDLAKFEPNDNGLIALGQALNDPDAPTASNTTIPAGFTYFGQFVDHDITLDRTEGIPAGALDPAEIKQGRSPALELDSVYGRGPMKSPDLYEVNKVKLKLGSTTGRPIFGVTATFPNDLPRRAAADPVDPKQAIIGDPRNDENLIVAQMHVAFLKFHNTVVDKLKVEGVAADKLFAEARKSVVQHYQSIVLHDFVPRLVDTAVFDDVLKNGRKFYCPAGIPATGLCMPVEFSVAAYRLGHSLVRNGYQWNMVFSLGGRAGFVPELNFFFDFSQVSGNLGGEPTVPSDWIVDWRRMFDFSEQPGGVKHPELNLARNIDTKLANKLADLPEFATALEPHLRSLAVRNLLRGRLVGLPTGQEVAKKLGATLLTEAELASGSHSAVILAQGFDKQSPLWFYILKEAEVKQGGARLGEVGSRLVAETFHGLVEGSDHSILKVAGGWKPTIKSTRADRFTMNDMLLFVNDLNPLGDGP